MEEVIQVALEALAKDDDGPELPYRTPHSAGRADQADHAYLVHQAAPPVRAGRAVGQSIVYTAEHGWALMTAREAVPETARKLKLYSSTLEAAGHDAATLLFCREWSMVQKMIYVGESD